MKNIQPLVSVIIPAFNVADRIPKTLETIVNQDYKTLEIILVDDASTDDTIKVSKNILEKSKRNYKIVNHEKNSGVSAARNHGLDAANGKYIWFCDSDDLAEKNFVSVMVNKIELEFSDIVFCNIIRYYEDDGRYEYDFSAQKRSFSGEEYIKLWAKGGKFFWTVWNCLIRKNFIDKAKLRFHEKCCMGEDTEFIIKAIVSASKISFEQKALYIYVQHSKQSTLKYKSSQKNYEIFGHVRLAMLRIGRYVIRHTNDKYVRDYAVSFCIVSELLKQCKLCAHSGDREYYNRIVKMLDHKKIREIMLSTIKFFFREPELFFKSFMLIYFPNFYYWLRSKKGKSK